MKIRTIGMLLVTAVTGCGEGDQLYDYYVNDLQTTGSEEDSAEVTSDETTGDEPIATSTTSSTTGMPEPDSGLGTLGGEPPDVLEVRVAPASVKVAGPVIIEADFERAGQALVYDVHDGVEALVGEIEESGGAVELAVTSEEQFDGEHTIRVVAANAFGEDSETAGLTVDLPAGGSEAWVIEDDSAGLQTFGRAIAVHPVGVVVAVENLQIGATNSLVRLYDGKTRALLWESVELPFVEPHGIAVDGDGQVLLVGTDVSGADITEAQARVFTFDPALGVEPLTVFEGSDATRAHAIAIGPAGDFVVVGAEHQGQLEDFDDHDDVIVWAFSAVGDLVQVQRWGSDSEVHVDDVAEIAVYEGERVLLAGSSSPPEILQNSRRMLLLEYTASLELVAEWHDTSAPFDAISQVNAVAVDRDGGVLLAGQRQADENAPRFAHYVRLAADGDAFVTLPGPLGPGTNGWAAGAAAAPNGRVAIGYTRGGDGASEIGVAAWRPEQGVVWDAAFKDVGGGSGVAEQVAVDRHGYVYITGWVVDGDGVRLIVGKRHP